MNENKFEKTIAVDTLEKKDNNEEILKLENQINILSDLEKRIMDAKIDEGLFSEKTKKYLEMLDAEIRDCQLKIEELKNKQ